MLYPQTNRLVVNVYVFVESKFVSNYVICDLRDQIRTTFWVLYSVALNLHQKENKLNFLNVFFLGNKIPSLSN